MGLTMALVSHKPRWTWSQWSVKRYVYTWIVCLTLYLNIAQANEGSPKHLGYDLVEEVAVDTVIANLKQDAKLASTYPPERVSQMTFQFLTHPKFNLAVDQSSGILKTNGRIDRDDPDLCAGSDLCSDTFKVAVKENSGFIEAIDIVIVVLDINDNRPEFPSGLVTHDVLESAPPGNYYMTIPPASDPDSPANGTQGYTLVSASNKFSLQATKKGDGSWDVRIYLIDTLDRESVDEYQLQVSAHDGGTPALSGAIDVVIKVQDTNDNSPTFVNSTYEVFIAENIDLHTTILYVSAWDPDLGLNGKIVYSWGDQTMKNYGHIFAINNQTGAIYIVGTVDYEATPIVYLTVIAQDLGKDPLPSDATVVVNVLDMNDNPPEITINTLGPSSADVAQIAEDAGPSTFVAHVSVQDIDSGRNGQVDCSLNENHFTMQELSPSDYNVRTTAPLDREIRAFYNLAVTCVDRGLEPQVSISHIKVYITDINDNYPKFSQTSYSATMPEGNSAGAHILTVNATDKDDGKNAKIRYSIAADGEDVVSIHPSKGVIYANRPFDRESQDTHEFTVIASDHGEVPKQSSAIVVLTITDINDEYPVFTQTIYPFGVYENRPEGTEVGVVRATDSDLFPNNQFSYSLPKNHPAADSFAIHPDTGKIYTTRVLDREVVPKYTLIIFAIDQGNPPLTGSTTVSVHVVDVNDNTPVIEFPRDLNNSVAVSNIAPVGHAVTKIEAKDADSGENQRLSYYITSSDQSSQFFSLDEGSGVITTAIDLKDHSGMEYTLEIEAKDNGKSRHSAVTSLVIVVKKDVLALGQNILIVLIVSVLSGVIVAILVIAICLVKRQDYITRRTLHKYNCRTEAAKVLHGQIEVSDSDQWSPTCQSGNDPKDLAFTFQTPSPHQTHTSSNWATPPENDYGQPSWLGQELSQKCPEKEVELLEILHRTDQRDNDSAYSGDGSNTDSGRGGSVEGDQRPQPDVVRFSCAADRGSGRRKPEANQGFNVEDEPGRCKQPACTRLTDKHRHSDSSPHYSVEYRKPVTAQYGRLPTDGCQGSAPSYHDSINVYGSNGRTFGNSPSQRGGYTSTFDSSKNKPCNNLETVIEDDATTTTSGSYVMDQNDVADKMNDFGYHEISV